MMCKELNTQVIKSCLIKAHIEIYHDIPKLKKGFMKHLEMRYIHLPRDSKAAVRILHLKIELFYV